MSNDEDSDDVRIIRKYPNRRIYDTHDSVYIKIDDIRAMVIDNVKFKVIDSKTKEDITRTVLLQIIIDQESESNPLFSSENIKNFIRYYGQNQHQPFAEYLNQSLAFFQTQQEQFNTGMQGMINTNPIKVFSEINKNNLEIWQKMQKSFFTDKD